MLDQLFQNFKNLGYNITLDNKQLLLALNIDSETAQLSISLPNDYPYTFLQVRLLNKQELSFSIPHMLSKDYLCLYDLDSDRHDYKNYLTESEETLKRAEELLNSSKKGTLSSEYQNEFYDLWTAKESLPIFSMIEHYERYSILQIMQYKEPFFLLATNKKKGSDSIVNFFLNIKPDLNKDKLTFLKNAIYIPVKNNKLKKPIRNVSDLLTLIESEQSFDFFLKQIFESKITMIFLGIFNGDMPSPTLVALGLPNIFKIKGGIVKKTSYKQILKFSGSKEIIRYGLTDLSQDRLFSRGGEGIKKDQLSTYIVGCGSLGGFLSKSLCDSGKISEMLLQDNQLLKSENIGRHFCGINYLHTNKAKAVSKKINSNYPGMEILSLNHSFIDELLEKKDTLKNSNYDLLICSTGDENIEEEIINRLKNGVINKPTIIAWVEPFLIAGHFILINSPVNEKTENYIFDSERNIKISIVESAASYTKAEAGCQSHFMPYSGFEMQFFSQIITDQITNKKILEKEGNYHFTWFGKMSEARKNKILIKQRWRYRNDRELIITRIDQ
ncbi:hypothetical protein GXD46_08895 [Listeria monocytogenes]|nr:hypothetical protein [Listeria monocytogenes]